MAIVSREVFEAGQPCGINTPEVAVHESMQVAKSVLVAEHLLNTTEVVDDLSLLLVRATRRDCRRGSRVVLTHLAGKYMALFKSMASLNALGYTRSLRNGWNFHENFLAQGIDGTWYAGSPANYSPLSPINRIERVIASDSLNTVLGQIREEDGGLWPSAEFIQSQLISNPLARPQYEGGGKFEPPHLVGLLLVNKGRYMGQKSEKCTLFYFQNGRAVITPSRELTP